MFDAIQNWLLFQGLDLVLPALLTAVCGWFAVTYHRLTGQELEKHHRDALQSALHNGIRYAIQLVLGGKLAKDGTVPADQQALVLAKAREYVTDSVPDALRHFKVSDRKLNELLVPKLPTNLPTESLTK